MTFISRINLNVSPKLSHGRLHILTATTNWSFSRVAELQTSWESSKTYKTILNNAVSTLANDAVQLVHIFVDFPRLELKILNVAEYFQTRLFSYQLKANTCSHLYA